MPFLNFNAGDLSPSNSLRYSAFIDRAGISKYRLEAIQGDASKRSYHRVITPNDSFVLMDAKADNSSNIPFAKVAKFLSNAGFTVPQIIANDVDESLLLLTDLGKVSLNMLLQSNSSLEDYCYDLAVELCSKLANTDGDESIPVYSKDNFFNELTVFCDWYLSKQMPEKVMNEAKAEFFEIFEQYYTHISSLKPIPVLKDFMADNIIWQEEQDGIYKLGLIDFQDMVIGFPFYDLASILEDARRSVDEVIIDRGVAKYIDANQAFLGADPLKAYNIIATQKNLRILGVFYRLCYRDHKDRYMMYIPRVIRYIKNNLDSGRLPELKQWFKKYAIFPSDHEY